MPGSLQTLVILFFVFGNLGCVILFTMVSVFKARQARLFKNVNKHFRNFVSQNQQKTKNGMKSSKVMHYSYIAEAPVKGGQEGQLPPLLWQNGRRHITTCITCCLPPHTHFKKLLTPLSWIEFSTFPDQVDVGEWFLFSIDNVSTIY